ncbi:MAG: Crp/Fnr family transcriptional regulator [Sulfuricaulis sp.]
MSTAPRVRTTNYILQALPARELQRILAYGEEINIAYGNVLCDAGKQIRHAYFPNAGIISLLTPLDGHATVEVGLVGNEGMAGIGLFLGSNVSPVNMLVQGSGTAIRIKAAFFQNNLKRSSVLHRELGHFLYAFMAQVAQTAACNRHHLLGQRLARWLLMTQDRMQSNEFQLTQEFLAHMLGVRRVGVTEAAGLLQNKNLISYSRGRITILNRKGLERASCRCYRDVNNIRERMLN